MDLNPRTRKRLVAAASRREGACNRAGEPSVTFCAKEEQRRKCALIFVKNRSKRYKACSDEGSVDKKDTQSCNKKTNCEPSAAGRSWRGGAKRT